MPVTSGDLLPHLFLGEGDQRLGPLPLGAEDEADAQRHDGRNDDEQVQREQADVIAHHGRGQGDGQEEGEGGRQWVPDPGGEHTREDDGRPVEGDHPQRVECSAGDTQADETRHSDQRSPNREVPDDEPAGGRQPDQGQKDRPGVPGGGQLQEHRQGSGQQQECQGRESAVQGGIHGERQFYV